MYAESNAFLKLLFVFICCFAFVFSMVGYLTGMYTISYDGFAVDCEGYLYLGFRKGKLKFSKASNMLNLYFQEQTEDMILL